MKSKKYNKLTRSEEEIIEANYLLLPIKRLCAQMGRSSCCIRGYLKRKGLVIPPDIILQRKKDSQLKKGNVPINKGRKQMDYMSSESIERTKSTRFKIGQMPHNHKPVGYERINADGYTEVKVSEPKFFKLKQRIIYEEHYGIVLTKHDIIRFKDGNKQNFNLDNLYRVNNASHLFENRFCDSSLSKLMSGKNEKLQKALLLQPELLELKRTQIKLNTKIKNHEQK